MEPFLRSKSSRSVSEAPGSVATKSSASAVVSTAAGSGMRWGVLFACIWLPRRRRRVPSARILAAQGRDQPAIPGVQAEAGYARSKLHMEASEVLFDEHLPPSCV